jgi:hypothetical protein
MGPCAAWNTGWPQPETGPLSQLRRSEKSRKVIGYCEFQWINMIICPLFFPFLDNHLRRVKKINFQANHAMWILIE